jgi:acetyl esterase/lipase
MKAIRWIVLLLVSAGFSHAQQQPLSGVDISAMYAVVPNVTYLKADGVELKLDVYTQRESLRKPAQGLPTIVYFHGGGWVVGRKESSSLQLLPYLEKGWAAVNVQYRLGDTALAPAAVEDARCAVWWVKRNADRYGFDPAKIVLTGRSSGGHLALIAGMLTTDANLDERCPDKYFGGVIDAADRPRPELEVAAIINWAGITDVNDLIAGPNRVSYAVSWFGALTGREALAKRVSPLTYVRSGLPPVLTIHGDQDQVVPYDHALRLRAALNAQGVPNQLHTIAGKAHFDFNLAEVREANAVIDAFLEKHL